MFAHLSVPKVLILFYFSVVRFHVFILLQLTASTNSRSSFSSSCWWTPTKLEYSTYTDQ